MEEKVMRSKQIANEKTKEKSEPKLKPIYIKNDRANAGFSFETQDGLLNVIAADSEETLILLQNLLLLPEVRRLLGLKPQEE